MESLEIRLDYKFNNISLLKNALVHSSYANEVRGDTHSNERLEFLGDSVLSIIVAEYLFQNFKSIPEGELTKLRAATVCEKSLFGRCAVYTNAHRRNPKKLSCHFFANKSSEYTV